MQAPIALALLALMTTAPASAQQAPPRDALPGLPFAEGDVIPFEQVEKLRDFLPPEFWEHREYFFYEGMALAIGPVQREYGVAAAYRAATERHRGEPRIGRDGGLENYSGGMPFEQIDCGEPDAGVKIIWNFNKTWNGGGARAHWSYTYWDRGDQLPLYFKGEARNVFLKHRVEL